MAKIRGVKPELWTDENFVELSAYARLLWVGLWNLACDNGHVQDKSKQIKMRLLPTDDVNCADLLREIEAQSLIERGDGWITIPNLTHHQKPHKRWFVVCEKDGCEHPEGTSYGFDKPNPKPETTVDQPLSNGGAPVDQPVNNGGSTADVDCDVDVDGELMVKDKQAGKPATSKRHRLPEDFVPNDTNRRLAAERGLDLRAVFEQFSDHHAAKGSTMLDWHRAFNTWLRNERPAKGSSVPQTNVQGWMQLTNEIAEREGDNVRPFRAIGGAS